LFDLGELYQEIILDHNKRPRNVGPLEAATHHAEGYNPLCGDKIDLQLRVVDGRLEKLAFVGQGCAISQASASVLTEALEGLTVDEAEAIFVRMQGILTGSEVVDEATLLDELGSLAVFAGVRDYPSRVKCATLAWHALDQALHATGGAETASTEGSETATPDGG
jgi:nitrogen fixation NifU-like protein